MTRKSTSSNTATPDILVIADLDGTIIDSELPIADMMSKLANSQGCPLDSFTAATEYAGMSFKDRFNKLAAKCGRTFTEAQLQALHEEYQEFKKSFYASKSITLMPGIEDLLKKLSTHPHITLSLGSSNASTRSNSVLSDLNLSHYFNGRVYGSDMVGGRKKPDPAIFQMAMEGFGPERTLIIEDSIPGIKAARAAGAFTVAHLDRRLLATNPSTDHHTFANIFYEAGADLVIDNYAEFEKFVSLHWRNWPDFKI